jgi:hypothetical protein
VTTNIVYRIGFRLKRVRCGLVGILLRRVPIKPIEAVTQRFDAAHGRDALPSDDAHGSLLCDAPDPLSAMDRNLQSRWSKPIHAPPMRRRAGLPHLRGCMSGRTFTDLSASRCSDR